MKSIKIYMLCLLAGLLFSCGEDFEDFSNKAYLNVEAKHTNFLIKPGSSQYFTSLNVGIARPAPEDLEFTLKDDASLVATYNSIFKEEAIILPKDNYEIPVAKARIAKESVRSTLVDIEFSDIDQLDRNKVYVLPVTIASADNIKLLESGRTHYYIFKGGALINWAADIENNHFPIKWGNSSLASSMKEVTVEGMLYLRQIEREGSDSNILTFFGVENTFLIRLGDTFDAGQIMVVKGSGKYPSNANDRVTAPVGRWFHLAVTYSDSKVRIYLDGELQSTSDAAAGNVNLSSSCYIGKSYNDNRWWPGMICETRVWNKARTQGEIKSSMYYVDPESEGLVAYWKFDEGNGNTITDHTENGSTITANSALKWTSVSLPE